MNSDEENDPFQFRKNFVKNCILPGNDIFLKRKDLQDYNIYYPIYPTIEAYLQKRFPLWLPRRQRKALSETRHLPSLYDVVEKAAFRSLKQTPEESLHNFAILELFNKSIESEKEIPHHKLEFQIITCPKSYCNKFCQRCDHQVQKNTELLEYVLDETSHKKKQLFPEFYNLKTSHFLPSTEDKIKEEVNRVFDAIDKKNLYKPKFERSPVHFMYAPSKASYIYDQLKDEYEEPTLYNKLKTPENNSFNLYNNNPYYYSYINLSENAPLTGFPFRYYQHSVYPISSKFDSEAILPYRTKVQGHRFLFTFYPEITRYSPSYETTQFTKPEPYKYNLQLIRKTQNLALLPEYAEKEKKKKKRPKIKTLEIETSKVKTLEVETPKPKEPVPVEAKSVEIPTLKLDDLSRITSKDYIATSRFEKTVSTFKDALSKIRKKKISNLKDNINDSTYNFVFEDVDTDQEEYEKETTGNLTKERKKSLIKDLRDSFIESLDTKKLMDQITQMTAKKHNDKVINYQACIMAKYRLLPFPISLLDYNRPRLQDKVISLGWCRHNQKILRNIILAYELREHSIYFYKPLYRYIKPSIKLRFIGFQIRKTLQSHLLPVITLDDLRNPKKYTYIGGVFTKHWDCYVELINPPVNNPKERQVCIEHIGKKRYQLIPEYVSKNKRSFLLGRSFTYPSYVWRDRNIPYIILNSLSVSNNVPITLCLQCPTEPLTMKFFFLLHTLGCPNRYIYKCQQKKINPSYEILQTFKETSDLRNRSTELYAATHIMNFQELDIVLSEASFIPKMVGANFSSSGVGKMLPSFEMFCNTNEYMTAIHSQNIIANANFSYNEMPINFNQIFASIYKKLYCDSIRLEYLPISENFLHSLECLSEDLSTISFSGILYQNPSTALSTFISSMLKWPLKNKLSLLVLMDTNLPALSEIETSFTKVFQRFNTLKRCILSSSVPYPIKTNQDRFLVVPYRCNIDPLQLSVIQRKIFPYSADVNLSFCVLNKNLTLVLQLLHTYEDFASIHRLRLDLTRGDLSLTDFTVDKINESFADLELKMSNIDYPIKKNVSNYKNYLTSLYMFGSMYPFDKVDHIFRFVEMLNNMNVHLLDLSYCECLQSCAVNDYALLLFLLIFKSPLEVIYLNHATITDEVIEALQHVQITQLNFVKRNIMCISLRNNNITAKGFTKLLTFMKQMDIKANYFDFVGNPITHSDARKIYETEKDIILNVGPTTEQEKDLERHLLEYYDFLKTDLDEENKKIYEENVQRLWEQNCKIHPLEEQISNCLRASKNKKELTNRITALEKRENLLNFLINYNDFENDMTTGRTYKTYEEILDDNPDARTFNFSFRKFQFKKIVKILNSCLKKKNLETLIFSNMEMTNTDLARLTDHILTTFKISLKQLDLSFNKLYQACLDSLVKIIDFWSVRQLILDGNYLNNTVVGGHKLHEVIMQPTLKLLSINFTGIGSNVIEGLMEKMEAKSDHKSSLKRLQCQANKFAISDLDRLLEYLTENCPALKYLDIASNENYKEVEDWRNKIKALPAYDSIYINTISVL